MLPAGRWHRFWTLWIARGFRIGNRSWSSGARVGSWLVKHSIMAPSSKSKTVKGSRRSRRTPMSSRAARPLSQRNVSSLNNPRAASSEVATITELLSGSSPTRELVSMRTPLARALRSMRAITGRPPAVRIPGNRWKFRCGDTKQPFKDKRGGKAAGIGAIDCRADHAFCCPAGVFAESFAGPVPKADVDRGVMTPSRRHQRGKTGRRDATQSSCVTNAHARKLTHAKTGEGPHEAASSQPPPWRTVVERVGAVVGDVGSRAAAGTTAKNTVRLMQDHPSTILSAGDRGR